MDPQSGRYTIGKISRGIWSYTGGEKPGEKTERELDAATPKAIKQGQDIDREIQVWEKIVDALERIERKLNDK